MLDFFRRGWQPEPEKQSDVRESSKEKSRSVAEFREYLRSDPAFSAERMKKITELYADRQDRLPKASPARDRLGFHDAYRPLYPKYEPKRILTQRDIILSNDPVAEWVNRNYPSSEDLQKESGPFNYLEIMAQDNGEVYSQTNQGDYPPEFPDYYKGIVLTAEYGRAICNQDFRKGYCQYLEENKNASFDPHKFLDLLAPVTDYFLLLAYRKSEYAAAISGMRGSGGLNPTGNVTYKQQREAYDISDEERLYCENLEQIIKAARSEIVSPGDSERAIDQLWIKLKPYLKRFRSLKYDFDDFKNEILPKHIFVFLSHDPDPNNGMG